MTTSFFGGDPTMSHFSASPVYRLKDEDYKVARDRRIAAYKTLKDLGWKERYFQFKTKDEKARAAAKAACEKDAAAWSKKAGFVLEVCEGCML